METNSLNGGKIKPQENETRKGGIRIEFKPQRPVMEIATNQLCATINANLVNKIPNYHSSRILIQGDRIKNISIQIGFLPNQKMVITNPLAKMLNVEENEIYTLTDEAVKILEPFVNVNEKIPMEIVRDRNKTYILLTLNPAKTLENILSTPDEGYRYVIDGAINTTKSNNNTGRLYIALEKIQTKKKNK